MGGGVSGGLVGGVSGGLVGGVSGGLGGGKHHLFSWEA